jgi:non-specific serine/threonine protein kinase/serine/threonine-protein kinase
MSDQTVTGGPTGAPEPPPGSDPTAVGPYRILRALGEGGFGTVYEAEQSHPVRRRIALKVIKPGMDTREVIARFEAERQALALMDHPHIARVLDAGATESGRPYFVMEHVQGEPIAAYCDRNRLTIDERLALFEQVCAAVQHAHSKGVIHRDLKPSNVLVSTHDDRPFARVIDFGIAKATDARLTDMTLFTVHQQLLGTPLYMSPEQAEGSADIDTRTDIYSLGVILYELLTGTTPVTPDSLRKAALGEVQRMIREADPPRPSARLGQDTATIDTRATQRRTEPRTLARRVRGELDWIVMKALEKDRSRRYETANGLAMDVRRYLAGEPVLAAPPGRAYRTGKFVRRHRGAVVAASLVLLSLVGGLAAFAWQARVARDRAAELEQVANFQAAMLEQVDPTRAGQLLGDDVRARYAAALAESGVPEPERAARAAAFAAEWSRVNATDAARALIDRTILSPAVTAVEKEFAGQPLVAARLKSTLGERYSFQGMHEPAEPLLLQALEIRRREQGDDDPATLAAVGALGALYFQTGEYEKAETLLREAVERGTAVLGPDDEEVLGYRNDLALDLQALGRLDDAESQFREVLDRRQRVLGEDSVDAIVSLGNLGYVLEARGNMAAAETFHRDSYERGLRVLGPDHVYTLSSMNNLAMIYSDTGRSAEAERMFRELIDRSRRTLGEEHPDTLTAYNSLGCLAKKKGDLPEAEHWLRLTADGCAHTLGPEHPNSLASRTNLGVVLVAEQRYADALALLLPIEPVTRRLFAETDPARVAEFERVLASARAGLGQEPGGAKP